MKLSCSFSLFSVLWWGRGAEYSAGTLSDSPLAGADGSHLYFYVVGRLNSLNTFCRCPPPQTAVLKRHKNAVSQPDNRQRRREGGGERGVFGSEFHYVLYNISVLTLTATNYKDKNLDGNFEIRRFDILNQDLCQDSGESHIKDF